MFRDVLDGLVEAVGPVALKVLAAVACLVAFAPLVIAFFAPLLG